MIYFNLEQKKSTNHQLLFFPGFGTPLVGLNRDGPTDYVVFSFLVLNEVEVSLL